jgi:4-diphosphocytidyl-2-C-methyl-D-erythritol kinase
MSCETIELLAPAKVNLTLQVVGKRPDGYHELRSLMAPVSIFDRLTLTKLKEERIEVVCEGAGDVPGGEQNLCHRAAKFYFEQTKIAGGVQIRVEKVTPSGAGMGGGSSDAATTIMGLEKLYGQELCEEDKKLAAFEVGADVTFFFAEAPAWVGGIGEKVRPVAFETPLWIVVIHPGIILSTAAVFSNLNIGLTTSSRLHTIGQFNFQGIVEAVSNDLEEAARTLEPDIADALAALDGADAQRSMMTGSGSAVFGLFADEASANTAYRLIAGQAPERWWIEVASTLGATAAPDGC